MLMELDLSGFVRHDDNGVRQIDFAIEGMTCAACISDIETAMKRISGIEEARVNYTNHRLLLSWRLPELNPSLAVEQLRRMGYIAHPFEIAAAEALDQENARYLLRCLAVAGFAAMNIMLLSVSVWAGNASDITDETRDMFHWLSAVIALPAAAFAGRPFFTSALHALKRRSLNMDVPISLGVILSLGMSVVETATHAHHAYFDSALMLIFFLLCGRFLEQAMRRRTRAVAGNIAALRSPMAARLMDDGTIVQTPTSRLSRGDIVFVCAGERLPVDGVVLSGDSEVDESIVTGETNLRKVSQGGRVHSGTINYSGALHVRVDKTEAGGFLDDIERLLDRAASARSRYVGLAERASKIYAPVVHVTALATALGWLLAGATIHDSLVTAIAVLIITCPCALALAAPAVHVVASGALFRAGVLLHGSNAIERLAEIDAIVFDKTGTLTLPDLEAANMSDYPVETVALASRLALSSRHPLARALAASAADLAPLENAREQVGAGVSAIIDGVEARIGSAAFCSIDNVQQTGLDDPTVSTICFRRGAETAIFQVRQSLRADAVAVVAALRARGFSIEILSGDSEAATRAVAETLGIADWRAGVKPAEKVARLEALKARGRRVLMVGDGFNDAPALASAHASISPITAADVAQASADAVFLGSRLQAVADTIFISRKARLLMRQNLWIAVIYNMVAVPLAIAGMATPLVAALAMSGSSLIVTVNALRAAHNGKRHEKPLPRALFQNGKQAEAVP